MLVALRELGANSVQHIASLTLSLSSIGDACERLQNTVLTECSYQSGSELRIRAQRRVHSSTRHKLSTAPNPAATPPSSLWSPLVRRRYPASQFSRISPF